MKDSLCGTVSREPDVGQEFIGCHQASIADDFPRGIAAGELFVAFHDPGERWRDKRFARAGKARESGRRSRPADFWGSEPDSQVLIAVHNISARE
ncbi:MAG: hypothetical protein HYX53_17705 [Chloroflexi bacterium]|nr:hypothetical protein [Chloroflexota bacterium]